MLLLTAPAARRWYNRWGATPAEVAGVMPGDELVPFPKLASTRAVTIGAPPEEVWAVIMDPKRLREWVTIHRRLGKAASAPLTNGDEIDQTRGEL